MKGTVPDPAWFTAAALAGGACRPRGSRPAARPDPARGRARRRPRAPGAADPGLHGGRRLAGADGRLAAPRGLPALAGRACWRTSTAPAPQHAAPRAPARAPGRRAGPARGGDRAEPRRRHGQGARGRAGPTSSAASSRSARPTWTRSPCTRSCGSRWRPSAGSGRSAPRACSSAPASTASAAPSFWDDLGRPLPPGVGFVSVYSRSDGVVDWHACLDPSADEHVEITASHCGMAVQPARPGAPSPTRSSDFRGAPRRAGGRRSRDGAQAAPRGLAGSARPVAHRDALVAAGGAARPRRRPGAPP